MDTVSCIGVKLTREYTSKSENVFEDFIKLRKLVMYVVMQIDTLKEGVSLSDEDERRYNSLVYVINEYNKGEIGLNINDALLVMERALNELEFIKYKLMAKKEKQKADNLEYMLTNMDCNYKLLESKYEVEVRRVKELEKSYNILMEEYINELQLNYKETKIRNGK